MPFNIGPLELVIILLIVVALFGAGRIAGVGQALGKSVREFREEARNDDDDDDADDGTSTAASEKDAESSTAKKTDESA